MGLNKDILLFYTIQPPRRYTFEQKDVKKFVENNCKGKVLNLFAGKTRLNVDEIRVDLSDEFNPDYCMEAFEFLQKAMNEKMFFDTVILDPPYSLRKSMEKYNGKVCSSFTKIVNVLPCVLNDGGVVISLGYQSTIMGKSRGFTKESILLIGHGGSHHDTICVVEKKTGK